MYGSPANLLRVAQRMENDAARVRADATSLVHCAHDTRWESTAAAAHRQRMEAYAAAAIRAAVRVEEAAALLRRHAHRVASIVTDVEAIARWRP